MRRFHFISECGEMLLISDQMNRKGFVRIKKKEFLRIAKERFPQLVVR